MRNIFAKKDKRTSTEISLEEATIRFRSLPYGSDEREKQLTECERLHAMRIAEIEQEHKRRLDPNTILGNATQVGVVGLILNGERTGNITSKALQFVTKGRVR